MYVAFSIALTGPPWSGVARRDAGMPGTALDGDRGQQRAAARDPDGEAARFGNERRHGGGTVRAVTSPPAPVDSSSVTVLTTRSPASPRLVSASDSAAITMAATPPFMSHAPRPADMAVADDALEGVDRATRSGVPRRRRQRDRSAAASGHHRCRRNVRRAAVCRAKREGVRHHGMAVERRRIRLGELDRGRRPPGVVARDVPAARPRPARGRPGRASSCRRRSIRAAVRRAPAPERRRGRRLAARRA